MRCSNSGVTRERAGVGPEDFGRIQPSDGGELECIAVKQSKKHDGSSFVVCRAAPKAAGTVALAQGLCYLS